jgi:hypothetical protein
VAVPLGLPFSLLLLQFVLKDVAVHLAHPYDQKLPKALSVSLDRFFMLPIDGVSVGVLPSIMVFQGGPRSGTIHFRLESGFIRFSPRRPFLVQFALSQCQALEGWLELLPSRGCMAHSAGKKTFASCAKCYLLQLDASLRLLDAAALNRYMFTLSLELASWQLPVPPFWSPFPPL